MEPCARGNLDHRLCQLAPCGYPPVSAHSHTAGSSGPGRSPPSMVITTPSHGFVNSSLQRDTGISCLRLAEPNPHWMEDINLQEDYPIFMGIGPRRKSSLTLILTLSASVLPWVVSLTSLSLSRCTVGQSCTLWGSNKMDKSVSYK